MGLEMVWRWYGMVWVFILLSLQKYILAPLLVDLVVYNFRPVVHANLACYQSTQVNQTTREPPLRLETHVLADFLAHFSFVRVCVFVNNFLKSTLNLGIQKEQPR